ncbi:MAG: hypothetical protein AMXMBFR61_08310 [Fimbriimonadales bacterium]
MSYLFAVSLGPVQGFIQAARKTRDLWYGSEMLSEMSREVAKMLRDRGAELIFPSPQALEMDHSGAQPTGSRQPAIANKILVEVSTNPQPLAEAVGQVVSEFLDKQRNAAVAKAKGHLEGVLKEEPMGSQVAAFPEVYCAWWPMNGDYECARLEVDRLLAGRKALRDFAPNNGIAGRPKSSLDGALESVTYDTSKFDPVRLRAIGLRPGEELDGVSLIKRVNAGERFVSVSRVAVDPFVRHLKENKPDVLNALCDSAQTLTGTDWVQRFKAEGRLKHYDAFPYDTQLFYGPPTKLEASEAPELAPQAENFYKIASGAGSPPLYYAVLQGDGDRMGKVLGSLGVKEKHQEFSSKLVDFASAAADIVANHHGALVYSGGDDVLAFLPLDQALECADELQREFRRVLSAFEGATFTCGIAICHYSEHLQNALRWARDAERAGKKVRNAIGIHLHTRTAGEEKVEVVDEWGEDPAVQNAEGARKHGATVSRLLEWVNLLREDRIPDGAIFQLRALHREFRDSGVTEVEVLQKEAMRIIGRKRAEKGTKPLDEEDKKRIENSMFSQPIGDLNAALDSVDRFVNEMIIARHIARAKDVVEKGA